MGFQRLGIIFYWKSNGVPAAWNCFYRRSNGVPAAWNRFNRKSNGVPTAWNNFYRKSNGVPAAWNRFSRKSNRVPAAWNCLLVEVQWGSKTMEPSWKPFGSLPELHWKPFGTPLEHLVIANIENVQRNSKPIVERLGTP